jgi:hypothetical protein
MVFKMLAYATLGSVLGLSVGSRNDGVIVSKANAFDLSGLRQRQRGRLLR